jgi:hypothetical protein
VGLETIASDLLDLRSLRDLTLALLVAGVLADHHDASVATDHLALVTDRLDARVDLHVSKLFHVDPPALVESAGDADG